LEHVDAFVKTTPVPFRIQFADGYAVRFPGRGVDKAGLHSIRFTDNAHMANMGLVPEPIKDQDISHLKVFRFQCRTECFELPRTAGKGYIKMFKYKIDQPGTIKTFLRIFTCPPVRCVEVLFGEGDQFGSVNATDGIQQFSGCRSQSPVLRMQGKGAQEENKSK